MTAVRQRSCRGHRGDRRGDRRGIEPGLGEGVVAAAIMQVAPSRAQQRRLASALEGDPGLLTSGRPQGPPQIELLVRALQPHGARRLVLPRCAHCGEPKRLVQCDGDLRICSACDRRRRGTAEPCAACGNSGQVASRDERGQPRCASCIPYDGPEPVPGVMAHVSVPSAGPDQARLREVIEQAVPQPVPAASGALGTGPQPRAAHRRWRGRLAADQRSHPRAAGRRCRRRRGAGLPGLRPDGAAEPPVR